MRLAVRSAAPPQDLCPHMPPHAVGITRVPTTTPRPRALLDSSCPRSSLAHLGHATLVANYSAGGFAPGIDPSVSVPISPELRAASIAATSSIHPWNGRAACTP